MRVTARLAGRDLRLFIREPLNVFFALLSPLIVFLLYTVFLGNIQVHSITAAAPSAALGDVHGFVDAWMFGGIIALTTITAPLGALSVFVDDATSKRFRDFLVSPVTRGQLVSGYLIAAFTIGVLAGVSAFALALLFLSTVSGVTLGAEQVIRSLGWIVLSTAGFTALWGFVVTFLRTSGSFSALSTIVGTSAGFVAGAFLALGLLPDAVRSAVSALPFALSAMLLRQELTGRAASDMVNGNEGAITVLNNFYGIDLAINDWAVPTWYATGLLALIAIGFTLLAVTRIRTRIQ